MIKELIKTLRKIIMHQLKDSDIRKVLENYIHSACTATGTDFLEYCPKLMGRIKRYELSGIALMEPPRIASNGSSL